MSLRHSVIAFTHTSWLLSAPAHENRRKWGLFWRSLLEVSLHICKMSDTHTLQTTCKVVSSLHHPKGDPIEPHPTSSQTVIFNLFPHAPSLSTAPPTRFFTSCRGREVCMCLCVFVLRVPTACVCAWAWCLWMWVVCVGGTAWPQPGIHMFFLNLRVFIKDEPQQEEQEAIRSPDTEFAAIKLRRCLWSGYGQ